MKIIDAIVTDARTYAHNGECDRSKMDALVRRELHVPQTDVANVVSAMLRSPDAAERIVRERY